jgi:hypothetical protein
MCPAPFQLSSGQAEGEGARVAKTEGTRRTRNGKGACESSEERSSCIFSSFACGNTQGPSGWFLITVDQILGGTRHINVKKSSIPIPR